MSFSSASVLVSALFAALLATACSSSSETPTGPAPNGNGVNDVKGSCELRAAWQNRSARTCTDCVAAAASPSCDCEEFKQFGGTCAAQADAQRAEPACTADVAKCVTACPQTDCACVDGCYAQAAACKPKAAAREGCVTEVCSPYCK